MEEPILAIRFLMGKELLNSTQNYSLSLMPMKLSLSEKLSIYFAWRCNNYKCPKIRTTKSVRSGSVFENVKFKLSRIIHLLYLWASDYSIKNIIQLTGIGKKYCTKILWLRKSCAFLLQNNPIYLLGEGIVCQVDESCCSARQKYHVGRTVRQIWILGIADRSSVPAK
ncbi:hypothetical protein DMUE_4421 [Dictyocoela muelleri]|nr:hypothetical protein DMUE_4421 [Dictyocoela muelleri]